MSVPDRHLHLALPLPAPQLAAVLVVHVELLGGTPESKAAAALGRARRAGGAEGIGQGNQRGTVPLEGAHDLELAIACPGLARETQVGPRTPDVHGLEQQVGAREVAAV